MHYHHRGPEFHALLQELERVFIEKFGLQDYNIIFLTGSGTTANEAVIYSYYYAFEMQFLDAEFGLRLQRLSEAHRKRQQHPYKKCVAYPLYETSISRLNGQLYMDGQFTFLDMVSAFPYWLPPKGTAIWTTVSSKQLGAYPVLGIIGICKDLDMGDFLPPNRSVLNVREHLRFREKAETLTTPAIPLYQDLLDELRIFSRPAMIKKINARGSAITKLAGDYIIGTGPVVTFRDVKWLDPIANDFQLYRGAVGYQVFLWSGRDCDYETLCDAIGKAIR
jgi:aspartate aminotransferase-like enzyme